MLWKCVTIFICRPPEMLSHDQWSCMRVAAGPGQLESYPGKLGWGHWAAESRIGCPAFPTPVCWLEPPLPLGGWGSGWTKERTRALHGFAAGPALLSSPSTPGPNIAPPPPDAGTRVGPRPKLGHHGGQWEAEEEPLLLQAPQMGVLRAVCPLLLRAGNGRCVWDRDCGPRARAGSGPTAASTPSDPSSHVTPAVRLPLPSALRESVLHVCLTLATRALRNGRVEAVTWGFGTWSLSKSLSVLQMHYRNSLGSP